MIELEGVDASALTIEGPTCQQLVKPSPPFAKAHTDQRGL
jgi:hypothetical protein